MGLKAGWLAFFTFVWIIGAFLGSTFEYHSTAQASGQSYTAGTASFTNNSATVDGAGTTWVAGMEGGLIQCDAHGVWFKIDTVVNNIELTLVTVYTEPTALGQPYTMVASQGWTGTGTGGYAESPVTTLQYLLDVSNVVQKTQVLGAIPLVTPNGDYFTTAFKVVTWQFAFLEDAAMFYWIFLAPFAIMGVLSMILLVYGLITGNLTLT
ncbi:hypothetical protein LCGC14_3119490 [marine sediment metagenome]|uniref:Uncharacterized protein n=1 Tax=marine sediment metagenome TaxID=412755 RepID=A0A0F8YSL5_9ZZZZ